MGKRFSKKKKSNYIKVNKLVTKSPNIIVKPSTPKICLSSGCQNTVLQDFHCPNCKEKFEQTKLIFKYFGQLDLSKDTDYYNGHNEVCPICLEYKKYYVKDTYVCNKCYEQIVKIMCLKNKFNINLPDQYIQKECQMYNLRPWRYDTIIEYIKKPKSNNEKMLDSIRNTYVEENKEDPEAKIKKLFENIGQKREQPTHVYYENNKLHNLN